MIPLLDTTKTGGIILETSIVDMGGMTTPPEIDDVGV
jgi:hypothetical protein